MPSRLLIDDSLKSLTALFEKIYAERGRESIPPERIIRAQLLQVLYSIRSERQLVGQIQYNLLFRWFVGLTIDDTVWDHTTFSANRDRLIENDVIGNLFEEVINLARQKDLLSHDHFIVNGTLILAWHRRKVLSPKRKTMMTLEIVAVIMKLILTAKPKSRVACPRVV